MTRIARLEIICADFTSRHGSVAQRLVQIGRLREAEPHAERALAAVGGALNRPAEDAWMALAIVDRELGRPEEGWRRSRDLHTIFRERGEHDIARWLVGSPFIWAALVYWADDPARLGEMRALLEAHPPQGGEEFAALPVQLLALPALYVEGAWARTRQIIESVQRSPHAHHGYTHGAWIVDTLIAVAQGRTAAARAMIRAEFPGGAATEPGNSRCDVSCIYQRIAAALALEEGDLTEARSWLAMHDHWLAWSGAALGRAESHLLWARYHHAGGDRERACAQADQAYTHATHPRQPLVLLAAHRLLGELECAAGRFDTADRHLDEALTLADACRSPYERALTLIVCADLRATTGDTAAAQHVLDEAHVLLAPLSARPAIARAQAVAARLTIATPATNPRLPERLTAREAEILRALTAGLSNREIAATLNLSVRTVERHINNVYNKIGARGRAEATAYAFRHGLT